MTVWGQRGEEKTRGGGPGRKAGIRLTFFTSWEIVCKGAWRLAADAMGCYKSLVIQNDSNQPVERKRNL